MAQAASVEAPVAPPTISDQVVVTAEALHFRGEPGLSSAMTAVLPAGLMATVVGGPTAVDALTWYQLDVNGIIGWSAGEYLAPAGTALAFAAQILEGALFPVGTAVAVADGPLNLRAAAGLTGEIQEELIVGTAATILAGPTAADGYTWYQLEVNGVTGWSAGEFLAAAPTLTAPASTVDAAVAGS